MSEIISAVMNFVTSNFMGIAVGFIAGTMASGGGNKGTSNAGGTRRGGK